MKIPTGFIQEFTELLCEKYKSRINADYAFALAEVLLSSCCWNIRFDNGYGTGQPNIWIQVILPSGDIKSKPLTTLILPIMRRVEECYNGDDPKVHQKLIISSYTPESIIKFMNVHEESRWNGKEIEKEKHQGNKGLIWVDESTILTRGAKNKDYMSGILETDSLIYDGGIPERYTITHGLHSVPYCYKAKIQATTPIIYSVMEETDVIQGGWNRFDIVVGDPIDPDTLEEHDPEEFFRRLTQAQIDELLEHYSTQLMRVIWSKTDRVYFDEKATKLWVEYERKNKIDALKMNEKDLRRGYKNRMAEKALKRSVLYTISRYIDIIDKANFGTVIVAGTEMQMAIDNQEEYYSHWNKMLSEWKLSPIRGKSTLYTDEAIRERLKAVLQISSVVSRQRMIEDTGWNEGSKYLKDTLGSFVSEGKVHVIALEESRQLIKKHEEDKKWLEFNKVRLPVRGQAPTFYKWIENE